MRTIEIRRHSYTKKGEARGKGSHLSPEGVTLAREIGNHIGLPKTVAESLVKLRRQCVTSEPSLDKMKRDNSELNMVENRPVIVPLRFVTIFASTNGVWICRTH